MTTSPEPLPEPQVERLLRGYFQSRLPAAAPPPVVPLSPAAVAPPAALNRGRWVLAVCVAVVACVLGVLARQAPADRAAPTADPNRATASPLKAPHTRPAPTHVP